MDDQVAERIRLFEQVRAVPYATDGAHDAESLMVIGRGDCLAKADFLLRGFLLLGYPARRVRWLYLLPEQPAEVHQLVSRQDAHSAVEVLLAEVWVLVDATHDPALAGAGLTVASWDGWTDTLPAYPPLDEIWRPGDGPEPVPNGGRPGPDPAGPGYRVAFNRWLRSVRGAPAR
ncbi:transglutaminase domain-containing protein [Kitasatospora sp. NPDC001261]|uniref:transglutaminase domain-containing protein n=1 Tax=Kitasatospora sp. NPDC001261 TaxID=3364012 RepID=UPI0036B1216A